MPPTADELKTLSHAELVELFGTLDAPAFAEMHGEFRARILAQGRWIYDRASALVLNVPDRWVAKAFAPRSPGASEGHGYNAFEGKRGPSRRYRMRTFLGPSEIDGRPSFHLDYSAYQGGFLGTMRDEVRRLDEDLYLGMGRVGFTRRGRRRLMPFRLMGPPGPFHDPGDLP